MSAIITRTTKGSALTYAEGDANFNNLNTDKIEVDTTDTLTNKTIDSASNTLTVDLSEATLNGTVAEFDAALSDGSFVTDSGTETLTNKTIDSATNTLTVDLSEATVTGTTAEFNTALSDNDFTTLVGTETLTNKTITAAGNVLDATIEDIAGLTPTDGNIIIGDNTNFITESGATARTSLGLTIGTDVQAYDADIPIVVASQAEMEAGTETTNRTMNPEGVKQAIKALENAAATFDTAIRTAGNLTTTSTGLVDLTDMSLTLTTGANPIAFVFVGTGYNTNASASNYYNIDVDGTKYFGTSGGRSRPSGVSEMAVVTLSGITPALSAGSHTIKAQWAVSAGTGTTLAVATTNMRIFAWEVK